MDWNEHQFGAQVSSYRFQWLAALASPGVLCVSRLAYGDGQVGATSIPLVCAMATLNGVCYLLGSLLVRKLWLVFRSRK